ncbi:hypothetical protein HC251_06500 [Iamia sp. SCSIO 61187]|uniref:hypothetical protein n=1 Tax=Iamia sp. SCSIO 61187 TaxID=2722752 RepID=UPI001C63A678|nr:hypothetical protein [Iamia sp. SCSIO 61187]QYG92124.1 hypothetical protein HC251_06500 [Iamia sp. SCSIO 61187]
MRASPPAVASDGRQVVIRTALTSDRDDALAPLEVRVPAAAVDLLDPTATPGAAVLATIAAARGEDLVIEGRVDARAAAGAAALAGLLSTWWGTGPVTVEVEETITAAAPGTGVGLFFSRGVDSWSTLLDRFDAPEGERVTHLVWVQHGQQPGDGAIETALGEGHRRVAAELGLELVTLSTSARAHLDHHRRWIDLFGPVLVGTALHLGAGLRTLVLTGDSAADVHSRTGADPDVVRLLGREGCAVVLGNPDRSRGQRVTHILGSPLARSTLQVCWEGRMAGNCGRCLKCLLTMTDLATAGDPDPAAGFDQPLDADAVRALPLGPVMAPFMEGLVGDVPPRYEDVRRAWSDAWDRAHDVEPRPRWGDHDPPGLAGPGVPERVATALRATTGQAVAPAPAPLGWRPGAVPLRPSLTRHDEVRTLVATNPDRPCAWAVIEHHVRDGAVDGHQVALARRLATVHGDGPCYLPGIVTAPRQPPVLGPDAVVALLRASRARLWWRPDGDLEPLRVVEAIEQGCLPLQVMPAGPARDLAAELHPSLAPLVVAEEAVATLDLSPAGVTRLLAPAADHLLAGSAEHDLLAGAYR